jgi:hypothetical protein
MPEGPGVPIEARAGLCGHCEHARIVTNDRGSQFLLCQYADVDPSYPRYPRLPVLSCPQFRSDTASRAADRRERS